MAHLYSYLFKKKVTCFTFDGPFMNNAILKGKLTLFLQKTYFPQSLLLISVALSFMIETKQEVNPLLTHNASSTLSMCAHGRRQLPAFDFLAHLLLVPFGLGD